MGKQKIIPHLWFDREAKEAVQFYTTIFPDSEIIGSSMLHVTPSGDSDVFTFTLSGFIMRAINAGPYFKINPSISFFVNFDPSKDSKARVHLDMLWNALSEGGEPLMPLQAYPFSEHYGWIRDRYGVTWQLILTDPEAEHCGWLKDRYGVSWQISPEIMDTMMANGTPQQIDRLTKAFLKMKKLDVAQLEAAYADG